MYRKSGFTIVELLVVTVVVGIISLIAIVSYSGFTNTVKEASVVADLRQIATQLNIYKVQSGTGIYPDDITSLEFGVDLTGVSYTAINEGSTVNFCVQLSRGGITYHSGKDLIPHSGYCEGHEPIEGAPEISAVADSTSQITVSWSAVDGAVSYRIEYDTLSDFSNSQNITDITSTDSTITDLSAGTVYYIRAFAVNSGGQSSPSGVIDISTVALVPPTDVVATLSGTGGIANYSSTCQSGSTPEYRYATTHRSDGSTADSWGAWSSWSGTASNPAFISQGRYGRVLVEGRCSFGSGIYSASRYAKSAGEINQSTSGIGGSVSISGTAYPGAHSTATVTCPAGFTSYIHLSLRSRSSGGGTAWSPSGNNRGHDVTSSGGSGTTTVRTYSSTSTSSYGQTGHIGSISNVVAGYPSNMHNWIGGYAATRLYRCINPYITWRGVTSTRSGGYNTPSNNSNISLSIQSIAGRPAAESNLTSY
jgi:prepilin-type N-terminal cleavage/methylation domain-containing protein